MKGEEGVLGAVIRCVDALNDVVGRGVAWLVLVMTMIAGTVVVLRYGFDLGWVALQESYVWLHGIIFMAAAGYALLHDAHVRVDIFYGTMTPRRRAWVDLLGVLFLLLPMVAVVAWTSFPYVADSWARFEASREANGLPGLFLLKSFILLFCLLLGLQGISLAARACLVLRRRTVPPRPEDGAPDTGSA